MSELLRSTTSDQRSPLALSEIEQQFDAAFPALAVSLITGRPDADDPLNRAFAAAANDPEQHAPRWHRWGIEDHSRKFAEVSRTIVPILVDAWGLTEQVAAALAVPVDGIPKGDLHPIGGRAHDLGKYTSRQPKYDKDGQLKGFVFGGHAKDSGAIVRNQLRPWLQDRGLGDNAIEYLATYGERHFELGKVRETAYNKEDFSMEFAESEACKAAIKKVLATYPDFGLELGLAFLADSFSKVEAGVRPGEDGAIELLLPEGDTLNPVAQVRQMPVNIKIGERCLRMWDAQAA